jgi:hypothetical protein
MTVKQKYVFTGKRKVLAAKLLARKIGYLRTQDLPLSFFDNIPSQIINAIGSYVLNMNCSLFRMELLKSGILITICS